MKRFKYQISNKLVLGWGLASLLFVFISCNKDFPNIDEKEITDQGLTMDANEGGILLPGMMNSIVQTSANNYQSDQNHNGDSFVGYLVSPTPFQGNIQNITYAMSDTWNNRVWNSPTQQVLNQWVQMKKKGFDVKYPDLYAIGLICKVFDGQRLVDIFGPIPYTKYGTASEVSFDSEEEVYNALFADIDWAINALTTAEDADPDADKVRFAKFDKSMYGGDYSKWIKIANTLRLRMAMRISLVSPDKAKTEAEAAVNQKYGVLESADGSFVIHPPTENPIEQITTSWGDTRVGAPIITYLMGYHDPRLEKYVLPATDPLVAGQYIGIRNGIDITSKDTYINFSQANVAPDAPVKVMDVAESYFLRAEGVLRGWNMGGGSEQQFYEDGVKASFQENSVSGADTYLNDNTSTMTDYVDPKNHANNSPAISTITIKWDPNAIFQVKLERIMTQKYLALYPEGREAWAEFRRTGYPKLYLNVVNYSKGIIPTNDYIKRLTYPTAITNASKAAVDEAVNKFLGGKDTQFTALWWDVN